MSCQALESGTFEALQGYARNLSERIIPRGVETQEVIGIVLLLRDVLARSLFAKYQHDFALLNRILDAYEPAANRIANTVAVSFVQERERTIRQQQEAIREKLLAAAPAELKLKIEHDAVASAAPAPIAAARSAEDKLRAYWAMKGLPKTARQARLLTKLSELEAKVMGNADRQ